MIRTYAALIAIALIAPLAACSQANDSGPKIPVAIVDGKASKPRLGIPKAGSIRASYEAKSIELKTPAQLEPRS